MQANARQRGEQVLNSGQGAAANLKRRAQARIAHLIRLESLWLLIGLIKKANPKAWLGPRLQANQAVLT